MATGHFPAASAASVRRRTHASFVIYALFAAVWPLPAPAQDLLLPLGEQDRRTAQAFGLAGRQAVLSPKPETAISALREPDPNSCCGFVLSVQG